MEVGFGRLNAGGSRVLCVCHGTWTQAGKEVQWRERYMPEDGTLKSNMAARKSCDNWARSLSRDTRARGRR